MSFKYILIILALVYINSIMCLDIQVVQIDRFCHDIRYQDDFPVFSAINCSLIDYYKLIELNADEFELDQNICVYVTYIENFITLEYIVSDIKDNFEDVKMIFIYKTFLEIGYWQLKWTGELEECFPVYELDLGQIIEYENETLIINNDINVGINNTTNSSDNIFNFSQIINPWVKYFYTDKKVNIFYFLGLMCHGGAFLHSCYHIYYIFFVFVDFPTRDKIIIILANLGNLLRVIYMLTDPMSVNHNLPRFWANAFGSLSLPWSIMTWLFLAVKYNEILFSSISRSNEDIERNLDIKFGMVIGIVILLLIPQTIVVLATMSNNYSLEQYAQIINMVIFLLVTIGMSVYYVITTLKVVKSIRHINETMKNKKGSKHVDENKFLYRSLSVIISSFLLILIIVLGFIPATKEYPSTNLFVFAIGWAFALAVTQITQVQLFSYKFVKPSTSSSRVTKASKTIQPTTEKSSTVEDQLEEYITSSE